MALVKTRLDLATKVMKDLSLLAPGESPSGRDAEDIGEVYDCMLEEIRDERYLYWTSDAIPTEVFLAVVELIALASQKMFGFPAPTGEEMTWALNGAKTRIRARIVKPKTNTPTANGYF